MVVNVCLPMKQTGVRVITEASSGPQVTVGAYINSGSRHELDARTAGVANIATRLAASRGRALESSNGGSLTAWTTRESTSFRARVPTKDVAQVSTYLPTNIN
jgi:predicted Zn-dependent peptidase